MSSSQRSRPLSSDHGRLSGDQNLSTLLAAITVASIGLLFGLWPTPAVACEPGYCIGETIPADSTSGLPTNASIWVFYDTTAGSQPELELQQPGDDPVPADVAHYTTGASNGTRDEDRIARLTPREELAPDSNYRVTFGGHSACGMPQLGFSTGQGPEDNDLATPRVESATVDCRTTGGGSPESCATRPTATLQHFSIDGPSVEETFAYKLWHDGDVVAVQQSLPVSVHFPPDQTAPTECFRLEAVDKTGSTSSRSNEVCVDTTDADCSEPTGADAGGADTGIDAGSMKDASSMKMDVEPDADSTSTRADTADGASPSGTADPSSPADTATLPTRVEGGCGCRTASEGRPGGSALALLLFFVGMGTSRWMRRLAI